MDRALDWIVPRLLVGLLAVTVAVLATLILDGIQGYRAFPAVAECRQQGKEGLRRTFSANVMCVERLPYSVDLQ